MRHPSPIGHSCNRDEEETLTRRTQKEHNESADTLHSSSALEVLPFWIGNSRTHKTASKRSKGKKAPAAVQQRQQLCIKDKTRPAQHNNSPTREDQSSRNVHGGFVPSCLLRTAALAQAEPQTRCMPQEDYDCLQ